MPIIKIKPYEINKYKKELLDKMTYGNFSFARKDKEEIKKVENTTVSDTVIKNKQLTK